MLMLILLFFLSSCSFPANHAMPEHTSMEPIVTISQGSLLGTTLRTRKGRNVSAFMSIPYGEPPVGNLRFANPLPAKGWNGILNSTVEASMCYQSVPFTNLTTGTEDCLYLKVYTPQLPKAKNLSLLPVMVYIYGGGFRWEFPTYDYPQYLLEKDVVLVVPNHRVDALGYLSTGDEEASGNWGLKDQVLALEWICANIKYFGGDPDRVTIFGQSAGAAAIHLLTLSPTADGLFHKYIIQSGSSLAIWSYQPRAMIAQRAFQLGKYVNCNNDTSKALIECLRTLEVSQIIQAETQFDSPVLQNFLQLLWAPTDEPDIEGAFLTDSPTNLINEGKIRDLPSMTGVVRDEGLAYASVFYANQDVLQATLQDYDNVIPMLLLWSRQADSGAAWTAATKKYYFDNDLTTNSKRILENITALISDSFFNYPVYKAFRRIHALTKSPQYLYIFDYRGVESFSFFFGQTMEDIGIAHCDELIYLFPKDKYFTNFNVNLSEKDYEMVDVMVRMWTSFATHGNPTEFVQCDETSWEPYSKNEKYLRIGNVSDVVLEMQSSFFTERMQFWENLEATTQT